MSLDKKCLIQFVGANKEGLSIAPQSDLPEILDTTNSPILFGCRTGICATCLVRVHGGCENLAPADEDEREVLETVVENEPEARLACQIKVKGDIQIEYIGK